MDHYRNIIIHRCYLWHVPPIRVQMPYWLKFFLSIFLLVGCSPMLTRSEYLWGAYATRGDELLVVKLTSQLEPDPLPFPEREAPHLISQDHQVLSIDLSGDGRNRILGQVMKLPAAMEIPSDYDYVMAPDQGELQLWGLRALAQKLRDAASITCAGQVQYDEQYSDVLYYRCDEEGLVYRFEYPYDKGCLMRLGPAAGMLPLTTADYRFSSVAGTSQTFVSVGWSLLYAVENCSDESPKQVDRFTGPEQSSWATVRSKDLTWQEAKALPYRLIGMSSVLRIYQVGLPGAVGEIVVVSDGKIVRRSVLPATLRRTEEWLLGRYLPRSGRVIWNVMDPSKMTHVIHVFNLESGDFSLVELPLP